jgi:transcriptional regulator GlxA family with amidase domain
MQPGSSPGERSCDTSTASAVSFRTRRLAWDAATRIAAALAASSGIEPPMTGLDFSRIDKWLRAHLSEPLRVTDLAAHCGFGARRFHQLFEEAFGATPHRYLQRLRLDTALALLRDPRNTLTDVALTVGFGDQSAFTHAFTRRFGLAPGQWRAIRPH